MVKKKKRKNKKKQHTYHRRIHILGYIFSSSAFQKRGTAKIKISAPNISFIPPILSVVSLLLYLFFKYKQHNWDLTSCCDSQSGLPEIGISHLSRQKNQTASLHQTRLGTSKFKLFSVPTEAEVFFYLLSKHSDRPWKIDLKKKKKNFKSNEILQYNLLFRFLLSYLTHVMSI